MTDRRLRTIDRVAIVLIAVGALALRLHALAAQPLWSDEGLSLHRAALGLADLVRGRIVVDGYATVDPMPPLYFLALAAGRAVIGDGIWAQRFVGAALSATAAPLAWVAGRRLFGRPAAFAAAVLTGVAPFAVWYAQELRPYALVPPCVLAMTAIAAGGGPPVRRAWRWAAATVVGTLVHPFVCFAALAHGPFVLPAAWRHASQRARSAALAGAGVFTLVTLPRLVTALTGPTQVDFAPVDAAAIVRQALAALAVGISPSLGHPWSHVAPLALLATCGGVAAVGDPRLRRGAWMTVAGLVVPVAAVTALSAINPLYNGPRHVMPALPAFVLLAAAATRLPIVATRRMDAHRRATPTARRAAVGLAVTAGLAVAATAGAIVAAAQLQRQFTSPDYVKDDLRSLVTDLAVRYAPGDQVILHDALIGFTFDAEAKELGIRLPWIPVPHFPNEDRFAAEARLMAMRPAPRGRIWFVDRPAPRGGFEGDSLVQAADKHWDLVERRQYARMWLRVGLREYRVPDGAASRSPRPATATVAAWSNGLALNDVAFERPTAAAGQRLGLVTTWQAHAPLAGEVSFDVRLVGVDDGRTISLGADDLLRDVDVEDVSEDRGLEIALRAVIPLDVPAGAYDVQLRMGDGGDGPPAVTAGAVAPGEVWVTLATRRIQAPQLPPAVVRRLMRRLAARPAAEP